MKKVLSIALAIVVLMNCACLTAFAVPAVPEITSLELVTTEATAPGTVEIIAEVNDEAVEWLAVHFYCKETRQGLAQGLSRYYWDHEKQENVLWEDGKYHGELPVGPFTADGVFKIELVILETEEKTLAEYWAEMDPDGAPHEIVKELPAEYKDLQFTVSGSETPDATPPVVQNITFSETVTTDLSKIEITAEVTDDVSGPANLFFRFWCPETESEICAQAVSGWWDEEGTFHPNEDGKLHGSFNTESSPQPGAYTLTYMEVSDLADNWATYNNEPGWEDEIRDVWNPEMKEEWKNLKIDVLARELCAEHQWVDATCSNPKTCSVCKLTEGEVAHPTGEDWEHNRNYHWQICTLCGERLTDTRAVHTGTPCAICGYDPSANAMPEIKSITLSTTSATAPGRITVVSELAGADVEYYDMQFYCEETRQTLHTNLSKTYWDEETDEEIPYADGKYHGEIFVNAFTVDSIFKLSDIYMENEDGVVAQYRYDYEPSWGDPEYLQVFPEQYKDLQITVSGSQTPDGAAPVLQNITFSEKITTDPGKVEFIVEAIDAVSGVEFAAVAFRCEETGTELWGYANPEWWDEETGEYKAYEDGKLHGFFETTQIIPGTYQMVCVELRDKAGNTVFYSEEVEKPDDWNVQMEDAWKQIQIEVVTEMPTVTYGDANSDGKVNAKDAMLVLQYYTNKLTEDKLDTKAVDVDGNGKINAKDAMLILQLYTNKLTEFPVQAK